LRAPLRTRAYVYAHRRQVPSTVINLSASGMLLVPTASSKPGLRLRVDFTPPGTKQAPFCLDALLIREAVYASKYAWGIQFVDISPGNFAALAKLVHRQTVKDLETQLRLAINGTGLYKELPKSARVSNSTTELTEDDLIGIDAPPETMRSYFGSARKPVESSARPRRPPAPTPKSSPAIKSDEQSDVKRLYSAAISDVSKGKSGIKGKKKGKDKKKKSWWS